ncbi:MAG: LacI family DNA-binding transcriptional regulator [Anaerolineae bacterium]|nr:LacI family DNA-binding transcriptional regulator [Anaerolineae bacterium]
MITIHDVAKLAGVAAITVSRVNVAIRLWVMSVLVLLNPNPRDSLSLH